MADQPPTSPHIFTYIDARIPVRCHEHMAIVHRGGASAARGAEFVSEGLRRGHWCCCLAPAALHPGMLTRLRELGVDVERHLDDQTLQFPPAGAGRGRFAGLGEEIFCRGRNRSRSRRPLAGRGSLGEAGRHFRSAIL